MNPDEEEKLEERKWKEWFCLRLVERALVGA